MDNQKLDLKFMIEHIVNMDYFLMQNHQCHASICYQYNDQSQPYKDHIQPSKDQIQPLIPILLSTSPHYLKSSPSNQT